MDFKIKNDTKKEVGKLLFDFAKIGLAIAIIAPLIEEGSFSLYTIIPLTVIILTGVYLINKGSKDD